MYNDMCIDSKTQEIRNVSKEVIVIDTSFVIATKLKRINNFFGNNNNCIIPEIVIKELKKRPKEYKKVYFETIKKLNFLLGLKVPIETSDINMELNPLWTRNNDYFILTVCAKLKNQGLLVKLLSFDKGMLRKASEIGIEIYPMEYPKSKIYLSKKNKKFKKPYKAEEKMASYESLLTLKNMYSSNDQKSIENIKNISNVKEKLTINSFEKNRNLNDINIDQSMPEILTVNGTKRLVDTSSIDIFMGILKVVITSNGKLKDINIDAKLLYYSIESLDKVIVFTKLTNYSIEMKIGNIDEDENFTEENIQILKEGDMKKINKKYHVAIKEAFIKLLKISLQKVA